jgi:hypothetical protein
LDTFLDDDVIVPPDLLMRLLGHVYGNFSTVVDIVMPINIEKVPAYNPTIFHGPWQSLVPYTWDEFGPGLWPLPKGDLVGRSGMLVKKKIFDSLEFPWFRAGQLAGGVLQDDFWFNLELQRRGHTIWIDRDVVVPHVSHFGVTARRDEHGVYKPSIKSLPNQVD